MLNMYDIDLSQTVIVDKYDYLFKFAWMLI